MLNLVEHEKRFITSGPDLLLMLLLRLILILVIFCPLSVCL